MRIDELAIDISDWKEDANLGAQNLHYLLQTIYREIHTEPPNTLVINQFQYRFFQSNPEIRWVGEDIVVIEFVGRFKLKVVESHRSFVPKESHGY